MQCVENSVHREHNGRADPVLGGAPSKSQQRHRGWLRDGREIHFLLFSFPHGPSGLTSVSLAFVTTSTVCPLAYWRCKRSTSLYTTSFQCNHVGDSGTAGGDCHQELLDPRVASDTRGRGLEGHLEGRLEGQLEGQLEGRRRRVDQTVSL